MERSGKRDGSDTSSDYIRPRLYPVPGVERDGVLGLGQSEISQHDQYLMCGRWRNKSGEFVNNGDPGGQRGRPVTGSVT